MVRPGELVNLRFKIETVPPVMVKSDPSIMAVGGVSVGAVRVRLLAVSWGRALVGA